MIILKIYHIKTTIKLFILIFCFLITSFDCFAFQNYRVSMISPIIPDATHLKIIAGIKNELKKHKISNITLNIKLIENLSNAENVIINEIKNKPDILISLGTYITQIAKKYTVQNSTPLIFTAVTDPIKSNIINKSNAYEKITGISNYISEDNYLRFIKEKLNNINNVSVIFDRNEFYSVGTAHAILSFAKNFNLKIMLLPTNSLKEIIPMIDTLSLSSDAIFVVKSLNYQPMDIKKIIAKATKNKIPTIVNSILSLKDNEKAILVYPDYYEIGKQAGIMVKQVLINKIPIEMIEYKIANKLKTYIKK